ncbi:nephrin-like [Oratosquilla oratoria]|uniref:nephrin-like n=1 Tax=Oratosquilla oratoria TaxID=337810 RepID=UPI003F75D95E
MDQRHSPHVPRAPCHVPRAMCHVPRTMCSLMEVIMCYPNCVVSNWLHKLYFYSKKLLLVPLQSSADYEIESQKSNNNFPSFLSAVVSSVETLVERTVALPCLATQHPHNNAPALLLFYRNSSTIPFFSYDARSGDFWREGNSKIRDTRYEGRVFLNLTEPRRVHLNLRHVTLEDAGHYTCRVDFHVSPSLTSIVDLKVYAEPICKPEIFITGKADPERGPTIYTGTGRGTEVMTRTELGPFQEGQLLNLSCVVTGGWPLPEVTWWQDTVKLDNTSEVISEHPRRVINEITIGPLTRQLIQVPFTCRSENNPLSSPLDRTIRITIHMAPQRVFLPPKPTVVAGLEERIECRAESAYPEANVTWELRGQPLNFTSKETRQVGSDTVSWVRFIASPKDHDAPLTCRAASNTLSDPPVTTTVRLNVTHVPQVRLELGRNLRADHIREGVDVYFDCLTDANPPVQHITWYKEGKVVIQNVTKGILVGSGYNLVLQSVKRSDAGMYTCKATNTIGSSISKSLKLSVQYSPMCDQQRMTVTAVEGELVTLECRVDAHPANVSFFWLFNNTVDSTTFRKSDFTVSGLTSQLKYVAYSSRDYGTMFCWAANTVGSQDDPCAFTLQPAGAPEGVRDCILTNQSSGSLHVTCTPGADGGLTQTFRAEVFANGNPEPVRVLESVLPVFTLEGLEPGGDYLVTVTATNRKGSSPPVSLEAYILKVAEKRMTVAGVADGSQTPTAEVEENSVSPLVGVFVGLVGAFLLLTGATIFIARRHCTRNTRRTPDLVAGQELKNQSEGQDDSGPVPVQTQIEAIQRTSDQSETDPFLKTVVCTISGSPGSAGGVSTVFTIPANIPPPPQYCTSLCGDLPVTTQHSGFPQGVSSGTPCATIVVTASGPSPYSSVPSDGAFQCHPSAVQPCGTVNPCYPEDLGTPSVTPFTLPATAGLHRSAIGASQGSGIYNPMSLAEAPLHHSSPKVATKHVTWSAQGVSTVSGSPQTLGSSESAV